MIVNPDNFDNFKFGTIKRLMNPDLHAHEEPRGELTSENEKMFNTLCAYCWGLAVHHDDNMPTQILL